MSLMIMSPFKVGDAPTGGQGVNINKGIFGGGYNNSVFYANTYSYGFGPGTMALSTSLSVNRCNIGVISNEVNAIFDGGLDQEIPGWSAIELRELYTYSSAIVSPMSNSLNRESQNCMGNSTYGIVLGGTSHDPSGHDVESLTTTTWASQSSAPSSSLGYGLSRSGTACSPTTGFMLSGATNWGSPIWNSLIRKVDIATRTTTSSTTGTSQRGDTAGHGIDTYGVFIGGHDPSYTTVNQENKFTYATESFSPLTNITGPIRSMGAASNPTHSMLVGGYTGTATSDTVYRFIFASDTTSTTSLIGPLQTGVRGSSSWHGGLQ